MRYYLQETTSSRWQQLGRKILAGVILAGFLVLVVSLFIFFFSVFAAVVGALVLIGLLAILINSFHRPRER